MHKVFIHLDIVIYNKKYVQDSVFILFLSQSSLVPWTFQSDETTKGFYYVNKVTFRKHLRMGAGFQENNHSIVIAGLELSVPLSSFWGAKRCNRLSLVTNGQLFSQSSSIKPLKDKVQRTSG